MSDKPTKFEDLDAAELYRSALEDFAVPVEEEDKGKKKVLLAAFVEAGVNWEDYVAQHPEVLPEPEVASPLQVESSVPLDPRPERAKVRVNHGVQTTGDPYLIKMERDNILYETRGYRFTRENPYALVDPKDAEYILRVEDGFRQAWPSELEEFYERR